MDEQEQGSLTAQEQAERRADLVHEATALVTESNSRGLRLIWGVVLQELFFDAVHALGQPLHRVPPELILRHMGVKGISRKQIATHVREEIRRDRARTMAAAAGAEAAARRG